MRELIVDNFAGGGGASTGIAMALGRDPDIAINHDPAAVAMHRANHPHTKHFCENIWDVDPVKACNGNPVGLAWFSPDCKHFSKAKGGKPVEKHIRGLAWVVIKWAKLVRPRVIMLENVEEFKTWGPLTKDNKPDKRFKGLTFKHFIHALERYGYKVEYREMRACDYGAPTKRKRFFLVARCDGRPIVWAQPEYGDPDSLAVHAGILKPWIPAADIINWNIGCQSIFTRKKPLCVNTMRRIAKGLKKFVLDDPDPFIVKRKAPFFIQYHGEQSKNEVRGQSVRDPLMVVDSSNRYGLVTAFMMHFYGKDIKNGNMVKTKGQHMDAVEAFFIKYYGQGIGQRVNEPLDTITSRDRFGLVTVKKELYQIIDIGMRMLTPRELFDAQGFPHDYIIDVDADGKKYPKSAQVARCGNAVCPPMAAALVRANVGDLCNSQTA